MDAAKLPKTVRKFADKIRYWDDERREGNSLVIELQPGWCLDAKESHVFGVATVKDAASDLNRVQMCDCRRCVK